MEMRGQELVLKLNKEMSLEKIARHYGVDFSIIFRVKNGKFSKKFCEAVYAKDGISVDGFIPNEKYHNIRFYCEDDVYQEFLKFCEDNYGRVCTEAIRHLLRKAKNA